MDHLRGVVDLLGEVRLQANARGSIWWEGELELVEAGEKGRRKRRKSGGLEDGMGTGVGLRTGVDPRLGGYLPGGMKEVQERGDVEDPRCAVEALRPGVGRLLDVEGPRQGEVPHLGVAHLQGEDLRQDVSLEAGMREAGVPGDLVPQLEEAGMIGEARDALLRGGDRPRGEALRPVVMKDGPMVEPGDVARLLRGEALLRGGEDLRGGEIPLTDDSETTLQNVTMDLPTGAVIDLQLLLHEMTNPLRINPLDSLTRVGPRWPSVRRFQLTVWGWGSTVSGAGS